MNKKMIFLKELKNYSKIGCLMLVLMVASVVVKAGPVDENMARNVANKVLLSSQTKQKAVNTSSLQLLYVSNSNSENTNGSTLKSTNTEITYFYVFGTENNDGFVIVAADDRVTPILGYSDENGFSADNMPENLKWWLGEYAKQIQYVIDNDIQPTAEISQKWAEYLGSNENNKEE